MLYGGRNLTAFKLDAIGVVGFFVLFLLGPLTVFTPAPRGGEADRARPVRQARQQYVTAFEDKWIRRGGPTSGAPRSGDIQSLSDLGPELLGDPRDERRPVRAPGRRRLALATAVPLLPLALTVFSLEELVMRLLKIVF